MRQAAIPDREVVQRRRSIRGQQTAAGGRRRPTTPAPARRSHHPPGRTHPHPARRRHHRRHRHHHHHHQTPRPQRHRRHHQAFLKRPFIFLCFVYKVYMGAWHGCRNAHDLSHVTRHIVESTMCHHSPNPPGRDKRKMQGYFCGLPPRCLRRRTGFLVRLATFYKSRGPSCICEARDRRLASGSVLLLLSLFVD